MSVKLSESRGLKKELKQHHLKEKDFLKAFEEKWRVFTTQQPSKIKTSGIALETNRQLFEFRMPYHRENYRIAYSQEGDEVFVEYISTTLTKAEFLDELVRHHVIK